MAKAAALLFLLAALLCHLHTGDAKRSCGKADITIDISATRRVFGRQTEYEVEFGTPCSCPMKDVRVWCGGLEDSSVPLDAGKVEVHDGMCVLKQPVLQFSPVWFRYSSEVPVTFRVFNAAPDC